MEVRTHGSPENLLLRISSLQLISVRVFLLVGGVFQRGVGSDRDIVSITVRGQINFE